MAIVDYAALLKSQMKTGLAVASEVKSKNPVLAEIARTRLAAMTEEQKTILRDRALENFKRTAKELRRYLTPKQLNMLHNVLDELQDEIGGTF